jgi:hypothetical protein
MKLNSTVALTLILLVSMVAAGLISASWGTALGREALKGITQPDTRPTNNKVGGQRGVVRREELAVLPENTIITNVKARMNGNAAKDSKVSPPSPPAAKAPIAQGAVPQFPLTTKSQDVVLEVKSVRQQGEVFVLAVNLRNGGQQPVRFVYDALTITNEQGQTLKATTDGLPAELPASSEIFPGTISIPAPSLEGVKNVALSLSSYPDKQLQLQLPNIPVR